MLKISRLFAVTPILIALTAPLLLGQDPVSDSVLPTGRTIQPVGKCLSFDGRPVDLARFGKFLFAKDRDALRVVDVESFQLVQTIKSPGGASLFGLTVSKNGNVYFTNAGNGLHVFNPTDNPKAPYQLAKTIQLPADSFPCGICLSFDEDKAIICLSKLNSVAIVDLKTDKVTKQIAVGVAPFDVCSQPNSSLFVVSNVGGRLPNKNDQTAPSAGTETVVDKRGIASTGSLSVIDSASDYSVVRTIEVGRHPTTLMCDSDSIRVCNTNDDSISQITGKRVSTVDIKPNPDLPFGSMPSDILTKKDGSGHFVALAGNNAVAIISADGTQKLGLIPTGWYPVALESDEQYLFIANLKGNGSRAEVRDNSKGRNSHDHLGSLQRIRLDEINDLNKLQKWTDTAKTNSRIPQILRAYSNQLATPSVDLVPVPKTLGEPSIFKHVIYVIKENRTFDQVFGDVKEARAEPKLCTFPEAITPNHHALARKFGLLDNYYCNGVLSADGHSWATEANVTPYLERAFGGFARSYTFGDDPITYSSSGFIWDHFLDAGLSFRNYGEMDYATPPNGMKYQEIWKAYQSGEPIKFTQKIGIDRLRKYSSRDYPGWNMVIPDVLRMDRFLKEFEEFKTNNGLPNLSIVYLPQDHLGGGVTSRAHMADNDLAVGRLVEAVSHSEYWKNTLIVINEDDPQNGFDHIDGHRSLCLVVSAYSKPGVNHSFYNQTSVIRTILHLFGLPPMNQQDASAPLMTDCFRDTPDLTPYKAIESDIPLNETAAPKNVQSPNEQKWRAILATVPIERTGMKTEQDEDNLNRFVWYETKGWDSTYPADWAGPHARGLKKLGLILDPTADDE